MSGEQAEVTARNCPEAESHDTGSPLPFPFTPPTALEPPTEWAELREQCPVARVRTAIGDDAVLLTRYQDVRTMLSDPRFLRNPVEHDEPRASSDPDDTGVTTSMPGSIAHGQGHLRWRRLLGKTFTAKRATALQPGIAEITHRLIDDMQRQGTTADLRTALAFPVPVYVICELLGVPAADREKFEIWSDHALNLGRFTEDEVRASAAQLWDYLQDHVRDKRARPGDDLLSELTRIVDADDGRLSEAELIMTGQALLIAGHETTANMIGKMVAMLLSDRERWEQLLADPALVRSAVEEALRFDANLTNGTRRHITEPVEIGDTTIEAGTTVLSLIPSANRDDSTFANADEMDLTRSPNPHLSFGLGPHSCLGQALARIELQTVLAVLLERLPTLELAVPADDLRRKEGLRVGGMEGVPVRW